jgi:hypothetical protein
LLKRVNSTSFNFKIYSESRLGIFPEWLFFYYMETSQSLASMCS